MPPTIITASSGDKRAPPPGAGRPQDKRAELVTRVKYCNTLPDIPFDPKFVTYPFESTRFIQNNPTSLERNYKYEVLAEHDLGVTIDLINSDTYAHDPDAILSPFDEKLLEEDVNTPQDSRRSRHHAKSVSWLRRTEYISTEQTRFQPQTMDKVEAKVGYSIKKSLKDETLYMDRDSQIEAIEKTFQDSKIDIEKHYSKPNIVPVEVLPIYPDFKIWKYPCAQVIFDSDPAPVGRPMPAQIEEMSQAMIRGVMDESGEQFVAYFLPTEETMVQRKEDIDAGIEYGDDSQYTYRMAREYNWTVKSKANKGYEENYFLVVRDDGVFYNELETRVRLNKRRQKQGHIQGSKTTLLVKHRPLNAAEFQMQRYREKMLEPPGEEEEEEEANKSEEEEEKMEVDGDKDSNKSNSDQEGGSDKESGDEKKGSGDDSDHSGDEKDGSGDEKDGSGDEKDGSGDEKDKSGDEKDGSVAASGDERGSGDDKDASGDEKDRSGDEKDKSGDEKTKAATSASSSSSSSSNSDSEDSG